MSKKSGLYQRFIQTIKLSGATLRGYSVQWITKQSVHNVPGGKNNVPTSALQSFKKCPGKLDEYYGSEFIIGSTHHIITFKSFD